MYRKLFILALMALVTQFSRPHFSGKAVASPPPAERKGQVFFYHPISALPDADAGYRQLQTAVRLVSVHNDCGAGDGFTPKGINAPFTGRTLYALQRSGFCKNYIDHIYPSHHFW